MVQGAAFSNTMDAFLSLIWTNARNPAFSVEKDFVLVITISISNITEILENYEHRTMEQSVDVD